MKKLLTSLGIGTAMILGGVDASALTETPIERVEIIKGERVEAKQIGNVVQTSLSWKGEKGITVSYDMGEPTASEKLKDKRKKEVITEVVTDGFKIDILLNEKPDTNVFCQTIQGGENYDFFYQPALTAEEITEGASRPDNVVGSYAVYHKTLKNHKVGGTNYETGKAFHIYRPQVWSLSDEATKVWAELNYNNEQLCVTVPQSFLDTAEYPVRIDPTFGYTDAGASNQALNNEMAGSHFTATAGDITEMQSYTYSVTSDQTNNYFALYKSSDESEIAERGPFTVENNVTTGAWDGITITPNITVASEEVWLMHFNGNPVGGFWTRVFYDAGGVDKGIYVGSNALLGTTPEVTLTTNDPTPDLHARQYSIYATYTASSPVATTTPTTVIQGDIQLQGDVIIQ